jgi:hypothetical protein
MTVMLDAVYQINAAVKPMFLVARPCGKEQGIDRLASKTVAICGWPRMPEQKAGFWSPTTNASLSRAGLASEKPG